MFDEITITSSFSLHILDSNTSGYSIDEIPDVIVKASKLMDKNAQRCWKYEAKLVKNEICNRCNTVLTA